MPPLDKRTGGSGDRRHKGISWYLGQHKASCVRDLKAQWWLGSGRSLQAVARYPGHLPYSEVRPFLEAQKGRGSVSFFGKTGRNWGLKLEPSTSDPHKHRCPAAQISPFGARVPGFRLLCCCCGVVHVYNTALRRLWTWCGLQ